MRMTRQLLEKILNGDKEAISRFHNQMNCQFDICDITIELEGILDEAIRANNSYAMWINALLYIKMSYNSYKGMHLLEQARQLGNPYAMNTLAHIYASELYRNHPEAISLYKRAIELGNYFALSNMGKMYDWGLGVAVNYPTAIACYERAIQLGDTTLAKFRRATLYLKGLGGPVDKNSAAKLYRGAYVAATPISSVWDVARSNLFHLQFELNPSVEVNYYTYMAFLDNAYLKKISIYDFINLLAQDDLLSQSERLKYADKAFHFYRWSIPKDAPDFSEAARDLIGESNYEKASFLLRQWPHIQNAKYKQQTLDRALSYLANIPKTSKIRGEAVVDIGLHCYQTHKETNLDLAVAKAIPYLKEGMDLGNENAEMYYRRIMELVLDKEKIDESPLEELKKADERTQNNREIFASLDNKIKSYRFNLFFRSADAKVAALTGLKKRLVRANVDESYADIIKDWERKNHEIISNHRNIFFATHRTNIQTNTQLFIAELFKKCGA